MSTFADGICPSLSNTITLSNTSPNVSIQTVSFNSFCTNCRGSGCIDCIRCLFRLQGVPYTYQDIKKMNLAELEKLMTKVISELENNNFEAMVIYNFIAKQIADRNSS